MQRQHHEGSRPPGQIEDITKSEEERSRDDHSDEASGSSESTGEESDSQSRRHNGKLWVDRREICTVGVESGGASRIRRRRQVVVK